MLRGTLLLVGLLSLCWSLTALPSFNRSTTARDLKDRIVAGEHFKPGVLRSMLTRLDAVPAPLIKQPEIASTAALVNLRIAEEAARGGGSDEVDRQVETADHQLIQALSTNPSEAFLWLLLYSVETARSGFDPKVVQFLEASYLTGPHEGWIAVRRNRIALAIFPMLRERTQRSVTSEFSELVDSDFTEVAVTNLIATGWAQREGLLNSLQTTDATSKASFVKRLRSEGINLSVPGVEYNERPWH